MRLSSWAVAALALVALAGAVGAYAYRHSPVVARLLGKGRLPAPEPQAARNPSGSGCGERPWFTGTYELTAADGAGRQRTYLASVPDGYTGRAPLALVFALHAGNGTGENALDYGMGEAAGEAAIVVAPDGIGYKDYGIGWDDTCRGYDMVLFDRILADMKARFCIDETRVFAFGHSWGGDFATALACCRGDRLRGIGPNAATDEYADPKDYRTYFNLSCPVKSKAAVRFTHSEGGDSAYPAPLFDTTGRLYRFLNGCRAEAAPKTSGVCTAYRDCDRPVIDCSYPGLGHTTPPDYARRTWEFFESLR